jgi:hypothetical protein
MRYWDLLRVYVKKFLFDMPLATAERLCKVPRIYG